MYRNRGRPTAKTSLPSFHSSLRRAFCGQSFSPQTIGPAVTSIESNYVLMDDDGEPKSGCRWRFVVLRGGLRGDLCSTVDIFRLKMMMMDDLLDIGLLTKLFDEELD
uniref:SFRICE_002138 n=1 Tax=Spodoptera frugiperda TaxID=7108 RepID=A0A2H1VNX6_SPOFR